MPAVAAGWRVDPARWQEYFDDLVARIGGRFTSVDRAGEPGGVYVFVEGVKAAHLRRREGKGQGRAP